MKEYHSNGKEDVLSTIHQHYYAHLCQQDEDETKNIKIAAVRAMLGGGFDHTSKQKVMKVKEAMNGPNNNKGKEEIKNEHKRW